MSETNSRYLTELPYANLTDSEFKAVTASWNFYLSGRNVDLFDIVPNFVLTILLNSLTQAQARAALTVALGQAVEQN